MLSLSIKQKYLKKIVDVAYTYSAEIRIELHDADGIMMISVIDPAHVAFASLTIVKDLFDFYDNPDELDEIYLDLDKVKDVIKLSSGEDVIRMDYDTEKGRITFRFNNLRRSCGIPQTELKGFKIPNFEDLKLRLMIDASEMMKYLNACNSIGEFITLDCKDGGLKLSSCDSMKANDIIVDLTDKCTHETDDALANYPTDYMMSFFKSMGNESVSMSFNSDYPILLTSSINDGLTMVTAAIAPRIEECE